MGCLHGDREKMKISNGTQILIQECTKGTTTYSQVITYSQQVLLKARKIT